MLNCVVFGLLCMICVVMGCWISCLVCSCIVMEFVGVMILWWLLMVCMCVNWLWLVGCLVVW